MAEFTMPKLGLTMEEATIIEWLIADGATVAAGAAVMRIETDKVETEVEISIEGILHHAGEVGEVFRCGAVIGYVLAPGEALPVRLAVGPTPSPTEVGSTVMHLATTPAQTQNSGGRLFASPNARRVAVERGIDINTVAGTGPGGRIVSEDIPLTAPPPATRSTLNPTGNSHANPNANSNAVASIAARNLADLLGIDLNAVAVDPVEHRVTRDAVAAYVRQRLTLSVPPSVGGSQSPARQPAMSDAPLLQTPTRVIRMSGMRGTIAKRMVASLRDMAQLTLTMDAEMDAVVADREHRKLSGVAPGFTDYIVAATARALALHPEANSQVTADVIAVLPDIHVGLAVALDNGLIVPVVRYADGLSLADLSAETTRLADAARTGKLSPADYEGATCSVSALGMFGVDTFTPVINPPNAAIVGVGRLRDDLVLIDGRVVTTKRLTLSLTWDHRVLDGAPAASFCRAIVDLLAEPSRLG